MLKSSNSDNFTEVGVSAILSSDFFISVAKPPLSIKNMFSSKTSAKLEDASVKLLPKKSDTNSLSPSHFNDNLFPSKEAH